jgi:uncharacterized membrane protein
VKWEHIDRHDRISERPGETSTEGRANTLARMPLAEISFYNLVLFIHITAVVLAFGVTFSFPIVMAVARKGHERHMGFFHHMQSVIGSRLIGPLGGIVLLAGLYLAIKGPYDFGDPWIGVTLLFLIIILGVGGGYLGPREERLADMAERDIAAGPADGAVSFGRDYERLFAQVRSVTLVMNALILISIFLMVTKPGA